MQHRLLLALTMTCASALAPAAMPAQSTCAGSSFNGVVRDSTAALLPNAAVTVDGSTPVLSGPEGRFAIPCVSAGPHTLEIEAEGFAPVKIKVKLPASRPFELTLTPAVETTVNVEADSSTNATSTNSAGPAHEFQGKQLEQLADDPDDLLRELQQMASGMGGNPANATIAVDGFQDSTHLPPKASIAYIKINPDLFSAEYREPPFGNGGRVEVYTKPGQKTYHGALFTTNGSPWENARDPFSTSKAAIGKQRYGFELGGPLHRDSADFFTSLEYRRIDNFAVVNAIDLDSTGAPVGVVANVATPQRLWQPTAKVTWQISPRNTFILGFTGSISNLNNVGVGGTTLQEAGYRSEQYDHTLRLSDVSTISAHLMHEARVSLRWNGENDTPASTATLVQVAGAFSGGGSNVGPQRIRELRTEIDDDAILSTTHHTVKAGIQLFLNDEHRRLTTNFNGTYVFGGGTAPVLDTNNHPSSGQTTLISGLEQYRRALAGLPGGTPTAFTSVSGNPQVDFYQTQAAVFVQDDWKLAQGLTISAGLRYYIQNKPLFTDVLTPRLGILWAPGKDPKWTLHAHAGLFGGMISRNEWAEIQRQDGVDRVTRTVYNPTYGSPFSGTATTIFSARSLAPNLSDTLYGIYNIGGTRDLPHGFSLMTDLGYGRLWNYTRSNNINAPLNGDPSGPRPFAANLNLLQVQASGKGRLDFAFFGVENHKLKRVQFFAGAVHIDQFDNTNDDTFFAPQNSRSDAGEFVRRSDVAPWQTFGNASVTLPYKLQFSLDGYANGDRRYNITTGFDNNGDGNFNDRPQYALAGTPGAVQTPYGLLVAAGGTAVFPRNRGVLPWAFYMDGNLSRTFPLTRNTKAEHPQTLALNVRSSNFLNHTNVTSVGSVFNSPLFGRPFAADNGRRVEAGLRYSF